ncbi:hypothetical protein ACH5RR_024468 [Cinchona calisaya]|uniref:Transmembrane protein n=1 Tax=Cinchona calisaya TaxID=153742 RepID=A0ABD2YYV1_9GENT
MNLLFFLKYSTNNNTKNVDLQEGQTRLWWHHHHHHYANKYVTYVCCFLVGNKKVWVFVFLRLVVEDNSVSVQGFLVRYFLSKFLNFVISLMKLYYYFYIQNNINI